MELILIAYNEALDEEVLEIVEDEGLTGYTKWIRVHGRGRASGAHLGTNIWPGYNDVIALAVPADRRQSVLERVWKIRKRAGEEGIKAFVLPLLEVTE